jgi:hypothetical protein
MKPNFRAFQGLAIIAKSAITQAIANQLSLPLLDLILLPFFLS